MTPTDPTRPLSASQPLNAEGEQWLRNHPEVHSTPVRRLLATLDAERAARPPDALREALRAALPKAVNFRILFAAPVTAPVWDQIADDLVAALSALSPAPTPVDVIQAYTVLVSAIPSLYRSWTHSPNATATRLNRMLLDAAIAWVQSFQRATGRAVDDFAEFGAARLAATKAGSS